MAAPLTVAHALAVPALIVRQKVLDYATLAWNGEVLGKDELPPELMAKPNLVLIYTLPRIFRKLGLPHAAQFNEVWQHGPRRVKGLVKLNGIEGSRFYWMFSWAQFSKITPALRLEVEDVLSENVRAFPRLLTEHGAREAGWNGLRNYVRELRKKYRGKKEWKATSPDYRWTVDHPDIPLESRAMTTAKYWANGENPIKSDAYAAIGPCAIRAYMSADFRKEEGKDVIIMRPRRVGVRIWDDYNFRDSLLDNITGLLADGRASQFLGNWVSKADGSMITLHNSDFEEYKTWFEPLYNQHMQSKRAGPESMLDCTDYHPVSTWVEREIKEPDEYPLPAWW